MDEVRVIENKLDSDKFKFLSNFPVDSTGTPTVAGYRGKNCFSISLDYRNLTRIEGALRE
jgi:hypothetical protein